MEEESVIFLAKDAFEYALIKEVVSVSMIDICLC